jgi:hypothetical protein
MNKEFLKMQKLAGLITESQYKKLFEDQTVIDRILDKISAQGIESLTPEEKTYLDTGGKSDKPISGNTTVYVSNPYSELYKVENLPAIPNAKEVYFDCKDAEDLSTCENYPEMVEMLKNKNFKLVLDKISKHMNSNSDDFLYFHGIDFNGDFSSPIDTAYMQIAGDGMLYVVDSLSRFNDGYQTEEEWGVKNWKKL